MIKDILEKNESTSPNSRQLEILKAYFPACFTKEGHFDLQRFSSEIANQTNVVKEGYELKFLGKSYAKLLASTDTTTVIRPNLAHNAQPENANSQNVYISGDNLDGLKHLLKSYSRSIKCIYIDPPYNTGSDGFVYADKFTYTKESLQEKLSISEEEAERILELTRRGSASHSAWLMFMYSRLLLARDLLSDDGVIFISIDDNEQANLKLICDDVFGEENLMGTMIWRRRTSSALADNNFSTDHEYVVTYQRANAEEFKGIEKDFKGYSNPDNDPRGPWVLGDLTVGMTASMRPNQAYDLIDPISKKVFPFNPNRVWAYVPESMGRLIEENRVYFPSDGSKRPMLKRFQNELKSSHNPMSSIILDKVGLNTEATRLQQEIFGQNIFDYSKPMSLLTTLIPQVVKEGEIILDFFSGSGTTAHAVLELNSKANKPSRFISVQLPEPLNPEIDSQKIAFDFLSSHNLPTTLDYIGIERIKRAAALIRASHPEKELDLGFRHFVLEEPNTQTLDKLEHFDPQALLADTSLLEAFGKETILSTWLNADGYGLCSQAQNIDLAGYTAYYCQKHLYFIHEGFGEESLKALVALFEADAHFNPENLVLFGYSFPQWSINEMLEKNLKVLQDGERQQRINFSVRY